MEGKKIVASTQSLARDWERLREEEARSNGEKPRLGWDSSFSRNCKKRGKKKTSPYIAKAMGPTTYKSKMGQNIVLRASDGFDEEGRIDRRNFYFPKSIYFTSFGDIENCVQILCKKTVLPLSMAKQSLEVSNGHGANTKVVGNHKIHSTGQITDFQNYQINPQN